MNSKLCSCKLVIWIKTVIDQVAKKEEGIKNRNCYDQASTVVDISPSIERVSDPSSRSLPHLTEATKVLAREVRPGVHSREEDHHH